MVEEGCDIAVEVARSDRPEPRDPTRLRRDSEPGSSTLGDHRSATEHATRGREAYDRHAWADACAHLGAVGADQLAPQDLERLATAAHLTGEVEVATATLERLHHVLLDAGQVDRAARWAVWLAILLFQRGQHAQGGGWLSRAQRLLGEAGDGAAARGYVLVPVALQALGDGDAERALDLFEQVAQVAAGAEDPDLAVMGLLGSGQGLVALGEAERGLALLDEVMVAVTTGDVSPIMAGIAYCAVILACREVFDLRRAQEWTAVLTRWCDDQQDLQPYRGQCLVHRSEILQLHGDWTGALREVEQACAHLARVPGDPAMGMARYQHAELLRLRGEAATAEVAYREAAAWGHPVAPGLALLHLAEGRVQDAVAVIGRAMAAAEGDRLRRAGVLAAHAEVMLAAGEVAEANAAVAELEAAAEQVDSAYLEALAAEGRGAVLLAADDAAGAVDALGHAWRAWRVLDAPYEAARVRLRLARARLRLGDHDTAAADLAAARPVLQQLRAAPALAEHDELARRVHAARGTVPGPGGLSPRELEVLRLVATGATNREVADSLVISPRTVERHLSNVFTKLGVGSRAAATAWAYEHDVV